MKKNIYNSNIEFNIDGIRHTVHFDDIRSLVDNDIIRDEEELNDFLMEIFPFLNKKDLEDLSNTIRVKLNLF